MPDLQMFTQECCSLAQQTKNPHYWIEEASLGPAPVPASHRSRLSDNRGRLLFDPHYWTNTHKDTSDPAGQSGHAEDLLSSGDRSRGQPTGLTGSGSQDGGDAWGPDQKLDADEVFLRALDRVAKPPEGVCEGNLSVNDMVQRSGSSSFSISYSQLTVPCTGEPQGIVRTSPDKTLRMTSR